MAMHEIAFLAVGVHALPAAPAAAQGGPGDGERRVLPDGSREGRQGGKGEAAAAAGGCGREEATARGSLRASQGAFPSQSFTLPHAMHLVDYQYSGDHI